MSTDGYGDLPVLPEESTNLAVHVSQCAKRYNALRSSLTAIRAELRVYQVIAIPLLTFIAYQLWMKGTP